ncbi:cell envelope integrity protein CreD [Pelomonas sp. SE-A7]|uniref:cell envelope integrity protein CreD n=1 Tax=Pelomonas sp. SE-A7 TaxID=3054953 RepID=UPI00259CAB8B|nr:cell envelope integrity protein CreD [Pelomonas sp. SE-A7]MDM4767138.1 cell envelope integrity protein CreD [Pelomonas sp. SE-A7]
MGSKSLFFKLAILAAVSLVLLVVLARIGWLVDERQMRQREAVLNVEQAQAGSQTLLGPLLHRRCVEEWETVSGIGNQRTVTTDKREFRLASAPALLQVAGNLNQDARYRGLFKVNGYAGRLQFDAHWHTLEGLQPRAEHAGSRLSCSEPELMLASSDARGLRAAELKLDGQSFVVKPGTHHPKYERGLHADMPGLMARQVTNAAPLKLLLQLDLSGTERFALVPAAATTRLSLRSDWPHPSFGGRFLPGARDIGVDGFSAQWSVSELSSTAAADVLRERPVPGMNDKADKSEAMVDTLDVSLIDPVNPYVMSDRAIKYGVLFIALTFVTVGLVELLSGRRVHPVQYLLVGLALSLFFLLLLSLSEHLSFGLAYGTAAGAAVALLTHYGAAMLGSWQRGLGFGALIAVLYGTLFVLLRLEQAALVIGSLLLFALLAAVMTLTRKLDWYKLGAGTTPTLPTR